MNKSDKDILPSEKLDSVLLHLQEKKDELDCFYGYRLPKTYYKPKKITITQRELMHILDKLNNDGYVKLKMQGADGVQQDVAHYAINFDGEVFIQNGGYTKKYKNQHLDFAKKKSDLRKRRLNDLILIYAAIFAALGGCGLLILEILKYLNMQF